MKVRIKRIHPISNPNGADDWDGKDYDWDGNLKDVDAVAAFLKKKTGITMFVHPQHSRVIEGRAVCFPKRATTGVHSMWLERTFREG